MITLLTATDILDSPTSILDRLTTSQVGGPIARRR